MTIMHAIIAANVSVAAFNVIGMMVTTIGGERLIPNGSLVDRNFGRCILALDALVWVSVFVLAIK
jgi:hypothetical protein